MSKQKKVYKMPILGFLLIIAITTALLRLSICNKMPIQTIDTLFEAASAVTATGSSVKDLSQQFTFWGQLILLLAMEIGAVGFMMFFSVLFLMSKRKMKLSNTLFLSNEINTSNYAILKSKAIKIIQYTLLIEAFGAYFLSFRFVPLLGVKQGVWYSIFHAVSAFCNVGLDLFGNESLSMFADDLYTNCVFMVLMFLGSLGFFVLEDLIGWFCTGRKSKIQVASKLILSVSWMIIVIGTILLKIFNPEISFLQAIFSVVTARNTGLYTVDMKTLSEMNKFLISAIMFIGGAPGSNAGGIRVVVFAILILTTIANVRNREEVVVFYRSIEDKIIKKAITIFCLDFGIVLCGVFGMMLTDKQSFLDTLFYMISTFSNTGLTTFDLTELSFWGKCISIFVMYIGKIAPVTFILLFLPTNDKKSGIKYPNMDTML